MTDVSNQPRARMVIGCMSGTSLDGVDAVLTQIDGTGLSLRPRFIAMQSEPMGELRPVLEAMTAGQPHHPMDYLRAARSLGERYAEVVGRLIEAHNLSGGREDGACPVVDFVVAHGQTIWHAGAEHLSWQLFDPWPMVRRLRVTVCYDLRQADLVAGGQGAPITPLADWFIYRTDADSRIVMNLGGIANGTLLGTDPQQIRGVDICLCNLLIDAAVRITHPELGYDESGRIALTGQVDSSLRAWIAEHPAIGAVDGSRTLGREDMDHAWLKSLELRWRERACPKQNLVRTAVEAVADSIAGWVVQTDATQVVLAGGGARNCCLVKVLDSACGPGVKVVLSDEVGVRSEAREAMGFAVLGALCQDGVPISLPHVTGATGPGRAGAWVYA